jgi:chaperone BCS1
MRLTASRPQKADCCSRESKPTLIFASLFLSTRFSTTNHLERLDPALSRPGRMDVWVEFKNASRWQAEALFRNFFPSTEEDDGDIVLEGELEGIDITCTPQSPAGASVSSTLWSTSPSVASSTTSLSCLAPSTDGNKPPPSTGGHEPKSPPPLRPASSEFGGKNKAYLPPPAEAEVAPFQHSAKPLDAATLTELAKKFADSIPEDEFSVAALQGCELIFFFLDFHTERFFSPAIRPPEEQVPAGDCRQ